MSRAEKLQLGELVSSAKARFQRVSARKARQLADVIRGLTVAEARRQLMYQHRPSAGPIVAGAFFSAVANADEKRKADQWVGEVDELIVGEVMVDGGPMLKRFRPRAMGRAAMIRKRMAHVTIKLYERI